MSGDMAVEWRQAIEKELEQLRRYGVYEEVESVPKGSKKIDTKWVLQEKRDTATGELVKLKARLTARAFTQVSGVHYDEMFAPVACPEFWRLLLLLAIKDGWVVEQWDVEAAFLNAELKHELYVQDPSITRERAWRLRKGLYGLK